MNVATGALRDPRRTRIAQIDQKIAQLQAERKALVESLTFPVITLPVEITSEIFVHSLPDNPLDYSATEVAIILGRVCHQWRDITLSIPQLWAAWSFAIDSDCSLQQIRDGMKLWLSRSKDRPLSIRLYHVGGASEEVNEEDEAWWEAAWDVGNVVVPILLEHYRRWENIEFNVPVSIVRDLSSLDANQAPPNLTRLVLGSAEGYWGDLEDDITFLVQAPKLRSLYLVLDTQHHLWGMDPVRLPYAQLTSFTGSMFSSMECAFVLSLMPALVECVFHICDQVPIEPHHIVSSPTTLPDLKSLKLWSATPKARPVEALDYLTLPDLETLALGCDKTNVSYPIWELLERSEECAIRHFSCESLEGDELADCLESLSQLLTLELLQYDQQEAIGVLRLLHDKLHPPGLPFLPRLQGLTLHCQKKRHDGDFSFQVLLLLLEEMSNRPSTPLRCFRLTWTSPILPRRPNAEESARFKLLVAKGMDIYVGSQEGSWV
ncbi:hypothetical protein DFH07DRAFT_457593 [Mycena maculata]|uniref:F-box domain-containing protein n=1 Tax=Mycena maculata TaxID=230809 RepID=A0AAD7J9U7_9AGAR|nr:hypothetical protein DFH07DRAFT_457593 [Mycena maculata]